MDFSLTDEQDQIKQMVRDFAEAEIKPNVMEWDEAQHFPVDVMRKLGELGMLGAIFPEKYGGAGLSYVDYVNIIEELAVVESGVALAVAAHNSLCAGHIYLAGNEEQRQRFLPKLTSGEWIGCWALTEPSSGSDASGMHTMAVQRRRLMGAQRHQELHHERHPRECRGRAGGDRPQRQEARHHRVRRRDGSRRHPPGQEGEQARHADVGHGRAGARGLPRASATTCSARSATASSTR